MSDEKKNIKIPHHRSANFCSHFVNGALISGPLPNGNLNFVFYEDAVGIISETGIPQEVDGQYTPTLEDDDFFNFREDKARISMPMSTAKLIYELLKKRFEPEEIDVSEDESSGDEK